MTDVLRSCGRLRHGTRVTGLRAGALGGSGMVGRTERFRLEYSGESGSAPRSVMVKSSSGERLSRELSVAEAKVYDLAVPRSMGVRAPEVYHCGVDEDALSCLVVLEDLGEERFVRQVDGCGPERAARALAEVSRLHSSSWNHEPPPALGWLRPPTDATLLAFCSRWLRAYPGQWPEVLGEIPRVLVRDLDALADRLSRAPRVLVHGDFHCQNMAFSETGPVAAVTLIDFQFVQWATPMVDVARFLGTSLTPGNRRASETQLLRLYHDRLAAHGVSGYGPTDAVEDFRASLLWNLVTPLALHVRRILTRGTQWPRELPILERCALAVEDWDALTVL